MGLTACVVQVYALIETVAAAAQQGLEENATPAQVQRLYGPYNSCTTRVIVVYTV